MLGLIVTVGMVMIVGTSAFAYYCADDSRRRERMRRRWQAGIQDEMPPPPEFHLIPPRWRRRLRRILRRTLRRPAEGENPEQLIEEHSESSEDSSDGDVDADLASLNLEGDERRRNRLRRRLGARADIVVPPAYSESSGRLASHTSRHLDDEEEETSFMTAELAGAVERHMDTGFSDFTPSDNEHTALLPAASSDNETSLASTASSAGGEDGFSLVRETLAQSVERVQRTLRPSARTRTSASEENTEAAEVSPSAGHILEESSKELGESD